MNRNTFFKSTLIFFLLPFFIISILSIDIFAATEGTEHTTIELTEEELAYRERVGEITIGCPIQNSPLLFENEKTGQLEGITIDVLNMISEATGLTFHYQKLPSGNILPMRNCSSLK